ncbi:Uncharacterised protein [Actinobacillus pleuropneumoniae]|nr:Uncharacterised protein [Actinobacillus pleuropneumoniae]
MNVIPAFFCLCLSLIPLTSSLVKLSGLLYPHAKPGLLIILAAVMR